MESLIIIYIIILLITYNCILCCKQYETFFQKKDQIISQKNENINQEKNKAIILHFANWCGYCKQFKPVWENIKKYCQENKYLYYEIDHSDDNNTTINPQPIFDIPLIENSFPTLYLYDNEQFLKYEGKRDYNDIINLLK
jgi:thioredoxin-related protein